MNFRVRYRQSAVSLSFALCFLLLPINFQASTFTATLKNGTGTTVTTAYLHFELWNCGTNFPVVSGQPQTLVQFTFDLKPNAITGVITGTVIGNDNILCGNVASTEWIITPMFGQNQPFGPSHKYVICDAAIPAGQSFCSNSVFGTAAFASLTPTDGVAPPSAGFNPIYANPASSQTLTEPGGSQMNFVGTVNFCSASVLCGTGTPFSLTVNGGSALTAPVNLQTGATISFSNPSGSIVQAALLPCGSAGQVWTWSGSTWACQVPASGITVNSGSAITPPVNFRNGTNTTMVQSGSNVQVNVPTPFYNTIDVNGSAQVQEPILNLISGPGAAVSCVDNSGASRTDCTMNAPTGLGAAFPAILGNWEGTNLYFNSDGIGDFDTGNSNQVQVFAFRLPFAYTFNTVRFQTSSVTSALIGIGVYSTAGSRLIHWDSISVQFNNFAYNATPTGGAVTLQPGYYYWACATSISSTVSTAGEILNSGSGESVKPWEVSLVRNGVAANAMSSGILPTTLGTVTGGYPIGSNGQPVWVVEP